MGKKPSEEAKKFKAELLAAISGAHRINVIEHSWRYDFFDENGELVEDPPHIEYERKELTPELRTGFQAVFERMPGIPETAFSLCMFEPHHAIEFIDEEGSKSCIRICFKCGDTEWDGRAVVPPEEFHEVFRSLIEPLGFQAHREWQELTKDQVQQVAAEQPGSLTRVGD